MGTRADFYVGKGKDAEWLGSIGWDGGEIPKKLRKATTEEEFRKRLAKFVASRDDWTSPEDGWPWPWKDSTITDEVWAFADGQVWRANGYPVPIWFDPAEEIPSKEDESEYSTWFDAHDRAVFPDMSARKNVRFDSGSGLVVISRKE